MVPTASIARQKEHSARALQEKSAKLEKIFANSFRQQVKGLQWLNLANYGEFANPDERAGFYPNLEYPGGSGTEFLFSGGLWVGAIKGGTPIVTTVPMAITHPTNSDRSWIGSPPTRKHFRKKRNDDGDWTLGRRPRRQRPAERRLGWPQRRRQRRRYFDYDPEPRIDEKIGCDISADFIDNEL